jgi:hypothetical protein
MGGVTTVPTAEGLTLTVEGVGAAAAALGITTPLRRLTAAGLIAAPRSRGRGRGSGREYGYPARVADQLGAVAEAMRRSHRYAQLRHLIWWRRGGRLEEWSLWHRDRLAEVDVEARAWALPVGREYGLPPERERHLTEVAEGLRSSRMRGLPRRRLHTLADTEPYVRMWTSVLLTDDLLVPPSSGGAEEHWRRVAATPVDGEGDDPVGGTLGTLFQRGVGWTSPPSDGSGFGALACAAYVPHPTAAAATLASMTEERATLLRDGVLELAARRGSDDVLREQPIVAAIALMTMDRLDRAFPGHL